MAVARDTQHWPEVSIKKPLKVSTTPTKNAFTSQTSFFDVLILLILPSLASSREDTN